MSKTQNKLRNVDPNNSEAVKENITAFFHALQKQFDHDHNHWLQELDYIISRFAKYCVPHRIATENYLKKFIDSKSYYLVIKVSKCALLIQQVRPPQSNATTPKSSWRDHMNSLCTAAHKILDAIFGKANNFFNGHDKDDQEIDTSDLPLAKALSKVTQVSNAEDKQQILCRRLKNVLIMIQAMLVEPYPVGKPIRPQAILDVIVATMNNCRTSKDLQSSNVAELMTQALRSLDALVICLGANLIPFSPLVIRIVMQMLKWSSENQNSDSRKVRCVAYASLSRWLSVLHVNKLSDKHVDELTSYVFDDITAKTNTVTLRENAFLSAAKPTGKKSKKKWSKMMNQQLQQSSISTHSPGEQNKVAIAEERSDKVSIAALECAETFLTVCGIFLKPEIHKMFHERLVKECYSSSSCEAAVTLALLRALDASRKSAPPNVPPPSQYCLQLYSMLTSSPYVEISRFCSQALLDIRLHLHCSPPSLNFAIEVAQENVTDKNGKKRMSDRNREVLESLLGEKLSDAVSEEPAPKKSKQYKDENDQISISSDSNNTNVSADENEEHKWSSKIVIQDDSDKTNVSADENEEHKWSSKIVIQDDSDKTNVSADENEEHKWSSKIVIQDDSDKTNVSADKNEEHKWSSKIDIQEVSATENFTVEIDVEPIVIEDADEADGCDNDVIVVESVQNEGKNDRDDASQKTNEDNDDEISATQIIKEINDRDLNNSKNIYEAQTQVPIDAEKGNDQHVEVSRNIVNEQRDMPSSSDDNFTPNMEVDLDKNQESIVEQPRMNGIDTNPTEIVENGVLQKCSEVCSDNISVEAMLADFVDEINESGDF